MCSRGCVLRGGQQQRREAQHEPQRHGEGSRGSPSALPAAARRCQPARAAAPATRVLFLCPGGTISAPPLGGVGWVGGGQRENGAGGGVGGRRPRHSQAAGGWVWKDNLTGDPHLHT